jgi:hypothetical protein
LKVFIAYSHQDIQWLQPLRQCFSGLENKGVIECWDDHHLEPGVLWDEKIIDHLKDSDIVLLLISRHLLESKYLRYVELREAKRVVPVLLNQPPGWEGMHFSTLHPLPAWDTWICDHPDRDAILRRVAVGLEQVAKSLRVPPPPAPPVLSLELNTSAETLNRELGYSVPKGVVHLGWIKSVTGHKLHKVWFIRAEVTNNGRGIIENLSVCLDSIESTGVGKPNSVRQTLRWSNEWKFLCDDNGRIVADKFPEARDINPGQTFMCDIAFYILDPDQEDSLEDVKPFSRHTLYFALNQFPSDRQRVSNGDRAVVQLSVSGHNHTSVNFRFTLEVDFAKAEAAKWVLFQPAAQTEAPSSVASK